MSGLAWLIRDYVETRNGRIGFLPNGWRFIGTLSERFRCVQSWDKKPWAEKSDQEGRPYSLYRGRTASCRNIELWRGKLPIVDVQTRPHVTVPAKDCKACQFHEPARRSGRRRYPCCKWFRENNHMDSPAVILEKSVQQATELLG